MTITPRERSFRLAVCCSRLVRPVSLPISCSDLYTQPSGLAPLSERKSNWLRNNPVVAPPTARARSGEYPTTRLGSRSLIFWRWVCATCWCGRVGTLFWKTVATIQNLQRPDKLKLDSGTGGCYAFL